MISSKTGPKRLKLARINAGPDLAHQLQVVVQIMQGIQPRTQNLARAVQVVQISAREVTAGGAVAALIDRQVFIFVPRITQLQITVTREQPAITCIASWHHTVEHVDAVGNPLD